MTNNYNFPIIPPPPPRFKPTKLYRFKKRFLELLHLFKKKFLERLRPSVLGSGVAIMGVVITFNSFFSTYNFKPLNFRAPSQVLSRANTQARLQMSQQIYNTRYRTSSANALSNNPFSTNNMFGARVEPAHAITKAEASAFIDEIRPELEIEKRTEIVKVGGREYTIYLFESQGEQYWHPFGNVMTYERASDDVRELKKLVEKKLFPGYKLPPGYTIELDHAIPKSFANAMRIDRKDGAAVLVPGFANGFRTNNRERVEAFSNFDWRLGKEDNLEGGLLELVRTRLEDSIARNLAVYCYNDSDHVKKIKKDAPNIDFTIYFDIYPKIAEAYNTAYLHDIRIYTTSFCNKYDIRGDEEVSLFAFYNELLLQGIKKDAESADLYANNYFQLLGKDQNRIRPEYLMVQMTENFLNQRRLSKDIQSFIPSKKYKNYVKNALNVQFHNYESLISTLIKNCEINNLDIDIKLANNILTDFQAEINSKKTIKEDNISAEDLFKEIFTHKPGMISLGDFYEDDAIGKNLNTTLTLALQEENVVPNKQNIFFLERNKDPEILTEENLTAYQKNCLKN